MGYVLGVHFGHDASVALVGHNRIIHYEKERFTRIKHDSGDIKSLYDFALSVEGIHPDEILAVVSTSVSDHFNASRSRPYWNSLMDVDETTTAYFGPNLPCYWIPHHTAHLAYAFYCSPYDEAEALAMDGIGDPFYSPTGPVDYAEGFISHPIGSTESKWLMGEPGFLKVGAAWDEISTKLYGSWHQAGTVMALVGIPQDGFEFLTGLNLSVKAEVDRLQERTTWCFCFFFSGEYPAVLSGGCALNGIANYAVLKKCGKMAVPPSAGDGGLSVGAALYGLHYLLKEPRVLYSPETIAFSGLDGHFKEPNIDFLASEILSGNVVAFTHGRAESGPRALGHRSFLADPRIVDNRDDLNFIKGRQEFRPTAPVVLREFAEDYFHLIDPDAYDYMTVIAEAKEKAKEEIPAALHYDGTARIQIARPGEPIELLLKELYRREKLPVLLNTSLNLKGMPLVNDQKDLTEMQEKLAKMGD